MKKILSLVLLTGVLFFFGCTKNTSSIIDTTVPTTGEVTVEWKTYENTTDGFSLQYPSTWTFQENAYGVPVIFFSPLTSPEDTLKENVGIGVTTETKTYTIDEFRKVRKASFDKQFSEFVEVSNENITINGMDAKKVIYTCMQGDMKLQFEEVYMVKDNTWYIITYTATKATFDEFVKNVDEIIATFEIK